MRAAHYREFLEARPALGWVEVHSENYFGAGGYDRHVLERVRADYAVRLHGVVLGLGSLHGFSSNHLKKVIELAAWIVPTFVSEHLCWAAADGRHFNDLLPLPYTEEALAHVSRRVLRVQEYLGQRLLVENPSTYLQHAESCIPEWEFIGELARRTGCGILLDVNNVYVSARNQRLDARRFIDSLPGRYVAEIHLAGFTSSDEVLIDTHNRPVAAEVWALFARAIERFGRRPALIEWDTDLPPLALLVAEAGHAQALLEHDRALAA